MVLKMQLVSQFDMFSADQLRREEMQQVQGNQMPDQANEIDPDIFQAAKDFETAFIAQMLKFSGLGEAITTGGGEDVAAFTDFYIQSFAEEISDTGGFGLADTFYKKLILKSGEMPDEGINNVKL